MTRVKTWPSQVLQRFHHESQFFYCVIQLTWRRTEEVKEGIALYSFCDCPCGTTTLVFLLLFYCFYGYIFSFLPINFATENNQLITKIKVIHTYRPSNNKICLQAYVVVVHAGSCLRTDWTEYMCSLAGVGMIIQQNCWKCPYPDPPPPIKIPYFKSLCHDQNFLFF